MNDENGERRDELKDDMRDDDDGEDNKKKECNEGEHERGGVERGSVAEKMNETLLEKTGWNVDEERRDG